MQYNSNTSQSTSKMYFFMLVMMVCYLPNFSITAKAQVTATLSEIAPPSPFVDEWRNVPMYMALLQNNSDQFQNVYLRLRFAGQNREFTTISPLQTLAPRMSLPLMNTGSGPTALIDWNAFTADNLNQISSLGRDAILSGILPEGIYNVCGFVLNEAGMILYSTNCLTVPLTYPEQPFWTLPNNFTMGQPVVQFMWTYTGAPTLRPRIRYRLRIAEILPNQTSEKALQANVPILNDEEVEQAQYIYQAGKDLPMLPYHRYAARVTQGVYDNRNIFTPFGQAGGVSPINVFLNGFPVLEPVFLAPDKNAIINTQSPFEVRWAGGIADASQFQYLQYRLVVAQAKTEQQLKQAINMNTAAIDITLPTNQFTIPANTLPEGEYMTQLFVIRNDDRFPLSASLIVPFRVEGVSAGVQNVQVRVQDARSDKPVANAEVRITTPTEAVALRTDENGEVQFSGIPVSVNVLQVAAEGYLSTQERWQPIANGSVAVNVTLIQGRTVRGRVLNAQTEKPVAGARVTVPNAFADVTTVFSDSAGIFEFRGVIRGPARISAQKENCTGFINANIVGDGVSEVGDISLQCGGQVPLQISWFQPMSERLLNLEQNGFTWRLDGDTAGIAKNTYHVQVVVDTTNGRAPLNTAFADTTLMSFSRVMTYPELLESEEIRTLISYDLGANTAYRLPTVTAKDTTFFVRVSALNANGSRRAISPPMRFWVRSGQVAPREVRQVQPLRVTLNSPQNDGIIRQNKLSVQFSINAPLEQRESLFYHVQIVADTTGNVRNAPDLLFSQGNSIDPTPAQVAQMAFMGSVEAGGNNQGGKCQGSQDYCAEFAPRGDFNTNGRLDSVFFVRVRAFSNPFGEGRPKVEATSEIRRIRLSLSDIYPELNTQIELVEPRNDQYSNAATRVKFNVNLPPAIRNQNLVYNIQFFADTSNGRNPNFWQNLPEASSLDNSPLQVFQTTILGQLDRGHPRRCEDGQVHFCVPVNPAQDFDRRGRRDTVFYVRVRAFSNMFNDNDDLGGRFLGASAIVRVAYSPSVFGDVVEEPPAPRPHSLLRGKILWTANGLRAPVSATSRFLPNTSIRLERINIILNRSVEVARGYTDAEGNYSLSWIDPLRVRGGAYSYALYAENDLIDEGRAVATFNMGVGDTLQRNQTFTLKSFRVEVSVSVPQEEASRPAEGVRVELRRITTLHTRPDEGNLTPNQRQQEGLSPLGSEIMLASFLGRTDANGNVTFSGVIINSGANTDRYQLHVELPGYHAVQSLITQTEPGVVRRVIALVWRPAFFAGRVSNQEDNSSIVSALISPLVRARLRPGGAEEIFQLPSVNSDGSGNFTVQMPETHSFPRPNGERLLVSADFSWWQLRNSQNRIVDNGRIDLPQFEFTATKAGWNYATEIYRGSPRGRIDVNIRMRQIVLNVSGTLTDGTPRLSEQVNIYCVENRRTFTARREGNFLMSIPSTPGRKTISFLSNNYIDTTVTFTITQQQIDEFNARMRQFNPRIGNTPPSVDIGRFNVRRHQQQVQVTVLDDANGRPIANCRVSAIEQYSGFVFPADEDGLALREPEIIADSGRTNAAGIHFFANLALNVVKIEAYAEGYYQGAITWEPNHRGRIDLTIRLRQSGAIRGTVVDRATGRPLPNVKLSDVIYEATTDSSGVYEFPRLPHGPTRITARLRGYRTESVNVIVRQGAVVQAPTIELDSMPTPVNKILGFNADIDRVTPDPANPNIATVDGQLRLAEEDGGEFATMNDALPSLPFRNVTMDMTTLDNEGNVSPQNGQMRLTIREININFLNIARATIKNSQGIRLSAAAARSVLGSIRDSLEIELGEYLAGVPGMQTLSKLRLLVGQADRAAQQGIGEMRNFIPLFSPPGLPSIPLRSFLPVCEGDPSLNIGSYRFVLNCANSEFTRDRIRLSGRLDLNLNNPRVDSVRFSEIVFTRAGLQRATASLQPPLRIDLPQNWFIEARGGSFSQQTGFTLDGTAEFKLPGDPTAIPLNFNNLRLNLNGLSGGTFTLPRPINVYGIVDLSNLREIGFTINNRIFGLRGIGRFQLPVVNWNVNLDEFSFTTDGRFTLRVPLNLNFRLADFIGFNLRGMEIQRQGNIPRLRLNSQVDLQIPLLAAQAGGISFLRGNTFEVERIALDFNPGPARIRGSVEYSRQNARFAGNCDISVAGAFSIGAGLIKSRQELGVNISAGVTIPVGSVTITRIGGGLYHNAAQRRWLFNFNGTVAVAPNTEDALSVVAELGVESNPRGIVISGSGNLEVAGSNLANASLLLDFPGRRFTGNINVNINKAGVGIRGSLDIGILGRENTYYLDAVAHLDLWNIASKSVRIILAHNYNTRITNVNANGMFQENRRISGFYTSVDSRLFNFNRNFDVWLAGVRLRAHANYFSSVFLASNLRQGDIRLRATAGGGADVSVLRLSLVGASISGGFYTNIGYNNARFYFEATANLRGQFNLGYAPRACNSVNYALVAPIGARVCFDANAGFRYNTPQRNSGFELLRFSL